MGRMINQLVKDAEARLSYTFTADDIFSAMKITVRKMKISQKESSYFPLLFRSELEDTVMRERINSIQPVCV